MKTHLYTYTHRVSRLAVGDCLQHECTFLPLSSEYIRQPRPDIRQSRPTCKTVKARFWSWLEPFPGRKSLNPFKLLPPGLI